jgi:hypothetical protein
MSRARGVAIGSVLDAIAAERFIARVPSVEKATNLLSLTGYHLLPASSQRPELFPAVVLRFWVGSDDAEAVWQALESVCKAELEDQCSFRVVRLNARSRSPDFALLAFVVEVSASVAGTAVHLPLELHVRTAPLQPAESLNFPSVLSDKQSFRVPCQSLASYTADLMTKIQATASLDADAGLHFQLAYLVRHHWSKISVVADREFKALRGELESRGKAPLTQTLKSHRQVWAAAAANRLLAQRWSEFIGFRGLSRLLEPGPSKEEGVSGMKRFSQPASPLVGWSDIAEEIGQFLYRVG